MESFMFFMDLLHFALHTVVHSLCDITESAKISAPSTPEFTYFLYEFLTFCSPHRGPLFVCAFSESAKKKNQHRTHLTSFYFLMNSLHFALHTEVHSLCDFSESAKIPAPHTPEILEPPYDFFTFCSTY